mmetsp:Transcript_28248/g.72329  ORF Transcript_28248/g.72329 Transcript_28248/m.72329 type:complete len:208 (-) Transcript_28248:154-777(-)
MNGMGDEGAVALAHALRNDNHTITLELAANGIGPRGVRALAAALTPPDTALTARTLQGVPPQEARASALRRLGLNSNLAGDEGVRAMAAMMHRNTFLSTLELWDNGVSHGGAQAISDALRVNRAITRLGLVEHNDIATSFPRIARHIEEAIARNAEAHARGGDPLSGERSSVASNHASALTRKPEVERVVRTRVTTMGGADSFDSRA